MRGFYNMMFGSPSPKKVKPVIHHEIEKTPKEVYVNENTCTPLFSSDDMFHLPVTEESIQALIDNPNTTYDQFESAFFSMCNSEMGGCHSLEAPLREAWNRALYKEIESR